jgi:hypothetical protein
VSLTLSHYCPTAARLLLDGGPLQMVEDPPAFPPDAGYEGLDARAALPLLRPRVFLDWDTHLLWERHAVAVFADAALTPESALARVAGDAEAARSWTPASGPLADHVAAVLARAPEPAGAAALAFSEAAASWRLVAACVPPDGPPAPPAPDDALARSDAVWVAPAWTAAAPLISRYLAARAFASWCAVQGDGLRTAVAYLAAALGVVRVEAARACAAVRRPLDEPALVEAVRGADLLLLHLVRPELLARRLSRVEAWPRPG